jgi:AcrR family transcriptional regulator
MVSNKNSKQMFTGEGMATMRTSFRKTRCRRLIAAASEEFAQHGFASARVRTIAVAARVNLAAVNYYFGGKEGLYRATLSYLAGQAKTVRPAPASEEEVPALYLQQLATYRAALGRIYRALGAGPHRRARSDEPDGEGRWGEEILRPSSRHGRGGPGDRWRRRSRGRRHAHGHHARPMPALTVRAARHPAPYPGLPEGDAQEAARQSR